MCEYVVVWEVKMWTCGGVGGKDVDMWWCGR